MKKEQKTEVQVAAEKREMEDLQARILKATSNIPKKIMNEADFYAAKNFKTLAVAARKAAESNSPRLEKLRSAWSSIQHYYA